MTYGYVRVSSIGQNIDRQVEEMHKQGLTDNQIFIDKQSGKNFERENYQQLKSKLLKNDLLIIKSIDRLGRNYDMIIEEWFEITKSIECDILVLDMPLLDTRTESRNLIGKFISDIVLQILSFVAENERDAIKQRQMEGIRIAKEMGKHLGRPKYILPANFNKVAQSYTKQEISLEKALKLTNMKRSTFYKFYTI